MLPSPEDLKDRVRPWERDHVERIQLAPPITTQPHVFLVVNPIPVLHRVVLACSVPSGTVSCARQAKHDELACTSGAAVQAGGRKWEHT
ncbi:hypothetical protein GSI_06493 [Ganoderma sinense ZZ0214-1]|uniref:Uncharacterized protein n=1 Tax=Ganoderma sinense ZZ0214-1 TaxID=1077348 RepID=A0A2G8SDF4_9APHY|nr:hypothetical protein GSI_06493 [Ganoderma sinense ZZ0214-1]